MKQAKQRWVLEFSGCNSEELFAYKSGAIYIHYSGLPEGSRIRS
jgi:hypothetical protein